jgi:gamma-glutamylcyclotransferase (GGCT)/AIG2-like uncharacterized protein YtfP
MRTALFVYGTLRQDGCRAIPKLFPSARFLGFGTVKGWLYDFGDYPGLRLDANGLDILGEVYEVEPATLRAIDEIEGHLPGESTVCHYFRRSHPILMQDGTRLTADLYECNPRLYDCSRPLEVGDWIAWKQRAAAANG